MVDGVRDIEMELSEDSRQFNARIITTSGRKCESLSMIPAMIYREVWVQREYQPGDVVTRDGSMWHANRVTRECPGTPGKDTGWTLCVKRGKDGFDSDDPRRPKGRGDHMVRIK